MSNTDITLTDRDRTFVEVLFAEAKGDIAYAMKLAGYPKGTSKGQLVGKLQGEILEASSNYLAGNAPLAIMSLISTLHDPTKPGVKNELTAAKEILDRAGVVKENKQTIDIKQEVMFVLPAKEDKQDSIDIANLKEIDLDKEDYSSEPS